MFVCLWLFLGVTRLISVSLLLFSLSQISPLSLRPSLCYSFPNRRRSNPTSVAPKLPNGDIAGDTTSEMNDGVSARQNLVFYSAVALLGSIAAYQIFFRNLLA